MYLIFEPLKVFLKLILKTIFTEVTFSLLMNCLVLVWYFISWNKLNDTVYFKIFYELTINKTQHFMDL